MRGEHNTATASNSLYTGPSPRARGTRPHRAERGTDDRSIPACAGNTWTRATSCGWSPVHPRVRGEHGRIRAAIRQANGPSPRARGTRLVLCDEVDRYPVHPRVRGEHGGEIVTTSIACGPSPRARGTHTGTYAHAPARTVHPRVRGEHGLVVRVNVFRIRSIPACAGNTAIDGTSLDDLTVHPRVRGEHSSQTRSPWSAFGPSPRARGTRLH